MIILADHAENTLPPGYGTLGLPPGEFARHIAYDIGVKSLCEQLRRRLNASLVMSRFSRLLIDPNRGLEDPTLIMRLSDGAVVPSNAAHSLAERQHRIDAYYRPYDTAIARMIERETARLGAPPILLSIHSFTPLWRGRARPWHAGILWDRDPRFALPLIERLRDDKTLIVGDNEPYSGELEGDTMNRHGTLKGIPHALLEIRQDLIADEAGIDAWADRLVPLIDEILDKADLRRPLSASECSKSVT
ncbi:MAG: N-formylglutamate amidohydrolase [Pseudomonadota bacterium]